MQSQSSSLEITNNSSSTINISSLLESLRLPVFRELDAEKQIEAIERVRLVLKLPSEYYSSKKQLVNFLEAIQKSESESVDEEAQRRIQVAIDEWNIAPF